ncbi:MAG: S-layer homology domain-containing protein [Atopobiaceae bacterium]|nr:S-layer homology domain-containing protein [Atopobiaceae bacterium]
MNKHVRIGTAICALAFAVFSLAFTTTPAIASNGAGTIKDAPEAAQTATALEAQAETSFPDIQGIAHEGDVLWLASMGITKGFPDGTFRPNSPIARADMAAFLFRLAERWGLVKSDWEPQNTTVFEDVTERTDHAREIWWLASTGISKGWDLGGGRKQFRPYGTVARQDMAAFLFRLAEAEGLGEASSSWTASSASRTMFCDVDGSNPYNHHVEVWWLAQTGISVGWQVGNQREFRGLSPIARQDMAAFLHRLNGLQKSDTETPEMPI